MKEFSFDPYDFFGYLAAGFVILFGLELTVGVPRLIGQDLKTLDLTLVTIAAYVAGQLAATPAKAILESVIVNRLLESPAVNLIRSSTKQPYLRFLFPDYFSPLPPNVQERILERTKTEGLAVQSGEALFLHIRFRDYIRNDTALMARLNSFLNKYGFNRNLSFVSLGFSAAILIITPFDLQTDTTRYAILAAIIALLLFYRYLKFFRQYTYELFNSYAGKS
jgi:hypothetical protein